MLRKRANAVAVEWPSLPDLPKNLARAAHFAGLAVLQNK
jgi:hypothetical protein